MIKFSEMPYTRPSIADIQTAAESICKRIETAASAEEQIAACDALFDKLLQGISTT